MPNPDLAAIKARCDAATRLFPVIPYKRGDASKGPHPTRIPWHVADLAYSVYAVRYGRGQSLERLAERGGFHASEMDEYLPDWREQCSLAAELLALLAERDAEIERLRKTLAHVPGKVALAAKEAAGYGQAIRTMKAIESGQTVPLRTKIHDVLNNLMTTTLQRIGQHGGLTEAERYSLPDDAAELIIKAVEGIGSENG